MAIYRVPTRLIPDLWPVIDPHAVRACEHHPFLESRDVLEILLAGRAQLFLVTDDEGVAGFAAMEVVEYPRRKVANVMCLAGSRGFMSTVYPELFNELVRWAKELGADTFAVYGRPGWMRVLRRERGSNTRILAWSMRLGDDVQGRQQADDSIGAVEGGAAIP